MPVGCGLRARLDILAALYDYLIGSPFSVTNQLADYAQDALRFEDELETVGRDQLRRQLDGIDFALLDRLLHRHDESPDWSALAARAASPPAFRLDGRGARFSKEDAVERGEAALRDGKVGAILVAGGQGTRLGFPHPKGMFDLQLPSGRTLFQIFADRLLAVGKKYGVRVPLYLMTSPATHEETVAYFRANNNLGLDADDLIIFCQGTMPAVDAQTEKLLLESKDSLALSPDGHGGMLAAFFKHGCSQHARGRGVEQLFYFQVDNPLTRICDAEFIGYHLLCESEMSTQVVAKGHPEEKVGVVVEIDGKVQILEYSNLGDEATHRMDENGGLALWAGNTAIHVFDLTFLERMQTLADALPFHRAKKKVPYIDEAGQLIQPSQPNAIKFERFIFDLLPHAEHAIVVEIDPAEGFAPVKNADGEPRDTPTTSRAAVLNLARRWLMEAGVEVENGAEVEVSPLFALDAGELRSKASPGSRISGTKYLSQRSNE